MNVIFLSLSEVVKLHLDQIETFGGIRGIRDMEMLKSAVNIPAATYDQQFLHGTICEMASAYLFHIVKNHPFIDGNKRTGTIAALTFLAINGYEFTARGDDLLETVLLVAQGKMNKSKLSLFIEKWSQRES